MSRVALKAEKMNHHPEWSNNYSRVDVIMITHAADGLSTKDVKMSDFIDKLVIEEKKSEE